MRVGIMGGTFDPIHMGHLIAAEQVLGQTGLDEVRFMPANVPPHKPHAPYAEVRHRIRMVELAIAGHPAFRLEDIEARRGGTSYTIDTVTLLRQECPECEFSFIIGGDMVRYLPHWHRIEELVEIVAFIGLERPGYPIDLDELPAELAGKITIARMPQLEISSTDIRRMLAQGKSVRYIVPDAVYAYMKENRLYESQ